MSTISEQKFLAKRVLEKLKEAGFTALLAGGAPRDWVNDMRANDLDFYIQTDDMEVAMDCICHEMGLEFYEKLGEDKYDNIVERIEPLLGVYETHLDGQQIQFMFITCDPQEFVEEHFDLSICKVWYDGEQFHMNWEASLSFDKKLLVCSEADGIAWKHLDKIMVRDEWGGYRLCFGWKAALKDLERRRKEVPDNHLDWPELVDF